MPEFIDDSEIWLNDELVRRLAKQVLRRYIVRYVKPSREQIFPLGNILNWEDIENNPKLAEVLGSYISLVVQEDMINGLFSEVGVYPNLPH
jgi:hypothetical protein